MSDPVPVTLSVLIAVPEGEADIVSLRVGDPVDVRDTDRGILDVRLNVDVFFDGVTKCEKVLVYSWLKVSDSDPVTDGDREVDNESDVE